MLNKKPALPAFLLILRQNGKLFKRLGFLP